MPHKHDAAPQVETPERHPGKLAKSIWEEVLAADEVIRPVTLRAGDDDLPLVESWQTSNPKEAALAAGFRRGRKLLQAISYGHSYWEMENGLEIELNDETLSSQHEVVKLGTKRLLQLAILSRVPLTPLETDAHWRLPTFQDIQQAKQEIREELGVTEAYKEIRGGENPPMYPPDFPGISDTAIVDAIVSGKLAMGNSGDPEAQYWRP